MSHRRHTVIGATFSALAVIASGCGDGGTTSTSAGGVAGSGGSGGDGGSTTATTSSGGSGGSGGGGTGLCDSANARDIEVFGTESGALTRAGQQDYYRLSGEKGNVLSIDVNAEALDGGYFDPEHIDTVVTVFNPSGKAISQNDDPIEFNTRDSRLYTILPADGDFCIRVTECRTVTDDLNKTCASVELPAYNDYEITIGNFGDSADDGETEEIENGDEPDSANPVEYELGDGLYTTSTVWGTFEDGTDVDVFTFTPPDDVPLDPGQRVNGRFFSFVGGPAGNGSTASVGDLYIVDPETGKPYARVDTAMEASIRAPLVPNKEYWLFVTRASDTVGDNDFYFLRHRVEGINQVETSDLLNDDLLTAEPAAVDESQAFVEGNLPAGDVDHFLMSVPAGATMVSATCAGRRRGAGLVDLGASLLAGDGAVLAAEVLETSTKNASTGQVSLQGAMTVVLRTAAAGQDPEITGDYYYCGVTFN